MKAIHILRAGTHRDAHGQSVSFSAADLAACAAAYDPAKHEAPIVIGHPAADAPAYGWIGSLSAAADGLSATPTQVAPEFAELVAAGRYKKVSASLYPPGHAANPVPEAYYLRHIGFLGAQPPAIKGLRPAEFGADDAGTVEIEFAEDEDPTITDLVKRFFNRLLNAGQTAFAEPDYAGPHQSYPIASATDVPAAWNLAGHATQPDAVRRAVIRIAKAHGWTTALPATARTWAAQHSISLSEQEIPPMTEKIETPTPPPADFAEREAALAAREAALAKREAIAARKGITDFVEEQVAAGRVLPRDQAGLAEFMAALDTSATLEFGEGAEAVKQPASAWLREFIARLPNQVEFAERTAAEATRGARSRQAAPPGYEADPAGRELHERALAYAETHKVNYVAAVAAVEQETH